MATATLHWLQQLHGAGSAAFQYAVAAAVSALVGGIAVRTLAALIRHELFPGAAVPSAKQQVARPGMQDPDTHHRAGSA